MTSDQGLKETLPTTVRRLVDDRVRYQDSLMVFESEYLARAMEMFKGNQSRVANFMGWHRNTLRRKRNATAQRVAA